MSFQLKTPAPEDKADLVELYEGAVEMVQNSVMDVLDESHIKPLAYLDEKRLVEATSGVTDKTLLKLRTNDCFLSAMFKAAAANGKDEAAVLNTILQAKPGPMKGALDKAYAQTRETFTNDKAQALYKKYDLENLAAIATKMKGPQA